MKIGAVFPQTEFGNDPIAMRDYAQAVESLGFSHILAYDHVLGANPDRPGGWTGPYTHKTPFHEPFLLFSFMAAVTSTLEFATGVIILPQRQTALVAKQAATLDILCGGRFRLGIGVGWNEVEYIGLGEDFHNRGKRSAEQVDLLKKLWTEPLVNFQGEWHTIPDAGLNPLPIQQPIPIWFGGHADPVLQRVATVGDGWMPNYATAADARPHLDQLDRYLAEAGRSRDQIGIEPRFKWGSGKPEEWSPFLDGWKAAGATHMTLITMGYGFDTPDKHINALRQFAEAML